MCSLNAQTLTSKAAPAAIIMGLGFLAFGLIMILQPEKVKANFDRLADSWKQGSWHPYRMPFCALRMTGALVVAIGALFLYIAYASMSR
jgi:uncharacterized protein YjeT (DUF2065 family)